MVQVIGWYVSVGCGQRLNAALSGLCFSTKAFSISSFPCRSRPTNLFRTVELSRAPYQPGMVDQSMTNQHKDKLKSY